MEPKDINVLIACEESQVECNAFREAGFNAFSCDIQKPRRGAQLSVQIMADVTEFLHGTTSFVTLDGVEHNVFRWDLIIAHPPCTYLCKVGSIWMCPGGILDENRYRKMLEARAFFFECLNAKAKFVAVENPLPMARAKLPPPDCFVQPFWYGHPYSKKTLYWLKNLPPLMPGVSSAHFKEFVHSSRGKYRSRSFPGIAKAMADQWGQYVLVHIHDG